MIFFKLKLIQFERQLTIIEIFGNHHSMQLSTRCLCKQYHYHSRAMIRTKIMSSTLGIENLHGLTHRADV